MLLTFHIAMLTFLQHLYNVCIMNALQLSFKYLLINIICLLKDKIVLTEKRFGKLLDRTEINLMDK